MKKNTRSFGGIRGGMGISHTSITKYREDREARLKELGCFGHIRLSEYRFCSKDTQGCTHPDHKPLVERPRS